MQLFSSHVSANIQTGCRSLSMNNQASLLSQLDTLSRTQGLEQLGASAFSAGSSATQMANTKMSFCTPGEIPQPGRLVSLEHSSFSPQTAGPGLGRMGLRQAIRFALLQHAMGMPGLSPGASSWMQNRGGLRHPMGSMGPFGGAMGCFGGFGQMQMALALFGGALQGQLALGGLSHFGRAGGFHKQQTSIGQGQAASFPLAGKSAYLASLTNPGQNAKRLNVAGTADVKTINRAINQLGSAEPKITQAKPGEKGKPGKLLLSQEQVAAIRNAPDQAAAEAVVRKAIKQQTGKKLGTANMGDKNGIRRNENRDAMNGLLGTKVRAGHEKNSGSSLVMNEMVSDIASSVRGGNFGTTKVSHEYAQGAVGRGCLSAFGYFEGSKTTAEFANGPTALSVDLNGYKQAANTVGELYSPLIFDLEGQGLKLKNAGMIEVDLDGDGKSEMISDLSAHIGLLIFDSKQEAMSDEPYAAGKDMFGNGTDLSAYGIRGPQEDGTFENGFDALRALCERFELVRGDKQHLDAADLAVLEKEVGLAMRVGGVAEGEDQSFARIGVSRIALGQADKIQSIEQAEEDAYGNKLMRQDGATFVVNGETRDYCDIWFNIQARAQMDDFGDDPREISTSGLLAMQRRV
jgi:hypothetical protein